MSKTSDRNDNRNDNRSDKSAKRHSFDPYDSLPAGSSTPRMTSRGIIELFRKAARSDESRQFKERQERADTERPKTEPHRIRRPRGFDPYNSDS